jgi:hypothetical protein
MGCALDIASSVESGCVSLGQSCSCLVAAGASTVYFGGGPQTDWETIGGTGGGELVSQTPLPAEAMAPADCGLYWANGASVYFEGLASGHPALVVTGQGTLGGIAVDGTSVYFADTSGAIGKVARP